MWSVLGPATSMSVPGGVVVFAVNSLLYLNQSVPPYGVALNSLTTGTTAFPLRECWGRGVLKRRSFLPYIFLPPSSKINCP